VGAVSLWFSGLSQSWIVPMLSKSKHRSQPYQDRRWNSGHRAEEERGRGGKELPSFTGQAVVLDIDVGFHFCSTGTTGTSMHL